MSDIKDCPPDTNVRSEILQRSLIWLGTHYAGESGEVGQQEICHRALRGVLDLPDEDGLALFMAASSDQTRYDMILAAFTEILQLGLYYENHEEPATDEAVVAHRVWLRFMTTSQQPDLDEYQKRYAHLDAMFTGLEYWVSFTTGGLMEAVIDFLKIEEA